MLRTLSVEQAIHVVSSSGPLGSGLEARIGMSWMPTLKRGRGREPGRPPGGSNGRMELGSEASSDRSYTVFFFVSLLSDTPSRVAYHNCKVYEPVLRPSAESSCAAMLLCTAGRSEVQKSRPNAAVKTPDGTVLKPACGTTPMLHLVVRWV